MAVSIRAGVFSAMPVNIHQRAGQLQYPHLLCCGNQWGQQHSQLPDQTTWIAVHFKGAGNGIIQMTQCLKEIITSLKNSGLNFNPGKMEMKLVRKWKHFKEMAKMMVASLLKAFAL
ncbi:unnamed protein product [Lepidochelys kempii]